MNLPPYENILMATALYYSKYTCFLSNTTCRETLQTKDPSKCVSLVFHGEYDKKHEIWGYIGIGNDIKNSGKIPTADHHGNPITVQIGMMGFKKLNL